MYKLAITTVALATMFGCTVSETKPLADISEGLWTKICKKATADSEDRVLDCSGTEVIDEASTAAECEAGGNGYSASGCAATFGDWKECAEWEPDLCDPDVMASAPAGCAALAECS